MQAASPLTRDLTIDGAGLGAVGVLGLAGAVAVSGDVGRMAISWLIVVVVLGLGQVVVGGGWLRNAVADASPAPADVELEDSGSGMIRLLVPTVVMAVLVVLTLFIAAPLGAIMAGIAAGAAATDLRSRQWIAAHDRAHGVTTLRRVTRMPFATTRAPLWQVPAP